MSGRLHIEQSSLHAEPQQTPSAQYPEAHWFAPLHEAPMARLTTQAEPSQKKPLRHCPSELQVVPHELPAHAPMQPDEAPSRQRPLPSQVLAAYSLPAVHRPGAHSSPAP
jgi:hypothetical protein